MRCLLCLEWHKPNASVETITVLPKTIISFMFSQQEFRPANCRHKVLQHFCNTHHMQCIQVSGQAWIPKRVEELEMLSEAVINQWTPCMMGSHNGIGFWSISKTHTQGWIRAVGDQSEIKTWEEQSTRKRAGNCTIPPQVWWIFEGKSIPQQV